MTKAEHYVVRQEPLDTPLSTEFIREWRKLVAGSPDLNRIFASPEWFLFLAKQHDRNNLLLWSVWNDTANLVGTIPVLTKKHTLKFSIATRRLAEVPFRAAQILGSHFLLPEDKDLYQKIFTVISNSLPNVEVLYFDSVAVDSFLHDYLASIRWRRTGYFTYTPDGRTPYHYLDLPASFTIYLKTFKQKKRYNLLRQEKRLRAANNGALTLKTITNGPDVRAFLEQASAISRNSWQHGRLGTRINADDRTAYKFQQLADAGLLRSYLLSSTAPCAFVVGYQHLDTYHYIETGYDKSFSKFSPGAVLLLMIIQDLLEHTKLTKLNFGKGDASYKQQFGSSQFLDVSVFMFRNTLKNRAVAHAHQLFRFGVKMLKKLVTHATNHS